MLEPAAQGKAVLFGPGVTQLRPGGGDLLDRCRGLPAGGLTSEDAGRRLCRGLATDA